MKPKRVYGVHDREALQGNINRMCETDKIEELKTMYEWALDRVQSIFVSNLERLEKGEENDI